MCYFVHCKNVSLSLVSSTISGDNDSSKAKKEDADLALIRRFVVDLMMKILKDVSQLNTLGSIKYGKLLDLFELSGLLISTKFRDSVGPLLNKQATQYDQFHISKIYIENKCPIC